MDREMATCWLQIRPPALHIDEALRRIEDGAYGNCHSCGKQISAARLEAVPHARLCIECKAKEEDKK